jgi:hypothetical protein
MLTKGKQFPGSEEMLQQIADGLGVKIAQLFYQKGKRK